MMRTTFSLSCASVVACALVASAARVSAAANDPLDFQSRALPLLQQHCMECHGAKKQKGGVSFSGITDLPSILNHRDLWLKVRASLEAEEMPPDPDESSFKSEDRKRLIAWIESKVQTIDRSSPLYRDPGPQLLRQLTRAEYNNTLRDLLKVEFDAAAAGGIPAEDQVEGFANLAGGQVIDQSLLEKYFVAADATLAFIFDGDVKKNPKLKASRESILIAQPSASLSPHDAASKVLEAFMRRAFRRPIDRAEVDRLLPLVDQSLKGGQSFDRAIRAALKPILVSPHFLYRLERHAGQAGSTEPYRVNDHELAVRLSYFLWATMPDDELFAAADRGTLATPEVLGAQVQRMLADPKAKALTDQFGVQWLTLGKLRSALPSKNNFPTLTNSLKQAMQQETTAFLDNLRLEDRSVLDLLDADYTFVNEELARHYGLPAVKGAAMQRVALRPQDHRGGLLGMSSILTLTSHTDRTKPTARGKWILDVILGTPPAPPPADAGSFKAAKSKQEPKNFREKLALHATDASCAGCHKKIDPLGFALENYDAIGSWREQIGGQPVDNSGKLPGAEAFQGADGLKKVLHTKQDQFIRNLSVQMMTYALGRQVEYEDELAILEIGESLKKADYRFSALIRGVVMSRAFQYRRSEGPSAQATGDHGKP